MDTELEKETYTAPQNVDMKKKKKWIDIPKKVVKRECTILVTWTLLFVMRYLKLLFLDRIICLDEWFYYTTADTIESAVGYVVLALNIVVFVLCLYDFMKLGESTTSWYIILIAGSWIIFRPAYLIVRGCALKDTNAIIRGSIWGILYWLVLSYYALWYFEVVVGMFASCG